MIQIRLTSRQAARAGWAITSSASGRRRVLDPQGQLYLPTSKPRRAHVRISFRHELPPLYLRRPEPPKRKGATDVVRA